MRCVTKLSDSHRRLNYIAGTKTNHRWDNNLFTILTLYLNHGPGPVICGKEAQQVNSHFMWVSAQQLKVSWPQGLLKRSPLGVPFIPQLLEATHPNTAGHAPSHRPFEVAFMQEQGGSRLLNAANTHRAKPMKETQKRAGTFNKRDIYL